MNQVMKMTQKEVCDVLLALGGKEYPNALDREIRCFQFSRVDGPDCQLNDKPPSLHVEVFPDVFGHRGNVEFNVCGQYGGEWLKVMIYGVAREKASDFLPLAHKYLQAVWTGYTKAVDEQNQA